MLLQTLLPVFEKIIEGLSHPEQEMFDKLKNLSIDKLYHLKLTDACVTGIVQCGNLTSEQLQRLVSVELDRRKANADAANDEAAAQDRSRTFYVSLGSLVISLLALLVSVFPMFRKGGKEGRQRASRAPATQ